MPDSGAALAQGLHRLGIDLPAERQGLLLDYLDLLMKWNRAYNLTALKSKFDMVARHVLDSLSVLPYLEGETLLDIGSGAGLPGVPLAIARPEIAVTCIDSRIKKTQFIDYAVHRLGLGNVRVVTARVEQYSPEEKFDTLICRAFAGLADILSLAGARCHPRGRILAMKGVYPQQELETIKDFAYHLSKVEELRVPGLVGERHLVILEPVEQ